MLLGKKGSEGKSGGKTAGLLYCTSKCPSLLLLITAVPFITTLPFADL